MITFFQNLFDTDEFTPRWLCGNWSEGLGWLHIVSDLAIAGAYAAIPLMLVYFISSRKDTPFMPVFWLFALFIISCGLTHFIEATLFWHPWYRFSGLLKVITAIVSLLTVVALFKTLPKALALPGLARVNIQLNEEIAERKQAENALRESERQLNEAQIKLQAHASQLEKTVTERTAELHETIANLEHFSYTLVHDLRSPLRALEGYSSMIEDELHSGEIKSSQEYLRRVKVASSRMDNLIVDSLNYSAVSRQQLALVPVDLVELLEGMVQTYPNLHPDVARIHIHSDLPTVRGNAAALTQCFSNLLTNAIKFGPPDGKPDIRITAPNQPTSANKDPASCSPGFVRIWVEDNGIGIPEDWQTKIFGLFQRVSSNQDGTGLGLAIVQKVVDRMGGRVGVESKLGEGSRFWIELQKFDK